MWFYAVGVTMQMMQTTDCACSCRAGDGWLRSWDALLRPLRDLQRLEGLLDHATHNLGALSKSGSGQCRSRPYRFSGAMATA